MNPLASAALLLLPLAALAQDAVPAREAEEDPRVWVSVQAADKQTRNALIRLGMSIEEVTPGSVAGTAPREILPQIGRLGKIYAATPLSTFFPLDFPREDSAFHNYAETVQKLGELAQAAPELASVFPIGKSLKGDKDLLAIRLNTTAKGEEPSAKPGIVFLGTHHAREHLSTETPLLIAKHIIENREKPEIAALLAQRDVYFIPMVNPDGVEYDLRGDKYHMHRKNIRPNKDGSVGVDLNRNYDSNWCGEGASSNPRSDTYCGTSAFSEPETQAVKAFVEKRKNLKVLLSYHTFSELILYPWGHKNEELEDKKALAAYKAMAKTMAEWTGYKPQQSSELYVASGDTTDWSWEKHGIFSFTFELTPKSMWGGGFYPGAAAIATTVQANLRPALYLIGIADNPLRAAEGVSLSASGIPARSGR